MYAQRNTLLIFTLISMIHYFFTHTLLIPKGETKSTYDAFKKWQKEVNRKDKEFNPRFGAMEGNLYEGQALTDIAGLPSKNQALVLSPLWNTSIALNATAN